MARRMWAILMALVILFGGISVNVGAADTAAQKVYQKDERISVVGLKAEPQEPVAPGCKWDRAKIGQNLDFDPAPCLAEEHPQHTTEDGCYSPEGLICEKEIHKHGSGKCLTELVEKYYIYWWVVVEDKPNDSSTEGTDPDNSTTDDTTEDTTPDDTTGGNTEQTATLRVACGYYGADGRPKGMPGFTFMLLEPQGPGEKDKVVAEATTDEDGLALLDGLELEPGESANWKLQQQALPEELAQEYVWNDTVWNVTLKRHKDGSYEFIRVKAQNDNSVGNYDELYDKESNTLFTTNQKVQTTLTVDLEFGQLGYRLPVGVISKVTVTGPDGFYDEKIFPLQTGTDTPLQYRWDDLPVGVYTVAASDPVPVNGMKVDGPKITMTSHLNPTPVPGSTANLRGEDMFAHFTVTYDYKSENDSGDEPDNPNNGNNNNGNNNNGNTGNTGNNGNNNNDNNNNGNTGNNNNGNTGSADNALDTNTIIVKAVDDRNNALEGTEIGLFEGNKLIREWKATDGNLFVLDNLGALASSGQSQSFTLKQTKAPAGYRLSQDTFTVTINNRNHQSSVEIRKKAGGLADLFAGSGVVVGGDGKQIAVFVNERKTTQIAISCEVTVAFAEGCWQDETLTEECRALEYEFILTWENAKGEQQEETLLLTGGNSEILDVELPFGTDYKITAVNEEGHYTTTFSENFEGTVGTGDLVSNIEVQAVQTYAVDAGEALKLNITKVTAEDKRPMEGVVFLLWDPAGEELQTYTSGEEGVMEIADVLTAPGTYILEETETLEGYALLRNPVEIVVTAQYDSGNVGTLTQIMTAELVSDAVVQESDGDYWIENALAMDEGTDEKPSGGSNLGTIIGVVAAGVVGVAGAAVATVFIVKKYRKKKTET